MPLSKIQTIKSRGFTIVELAVVIVIIGILAGLVATSYNGWQKSIAEKEVRSEINIALAAVKSARNFSPDPITAMPNTYKSNARVTLVYVAGTGSEFCIDGSSNAKTNITLFVRQDGVVKKGTCAGGEIPDYLPEGTTILAATSISAGLNNGCALSSGNVYCWGLNQFGGLGNGTNVASSDKPVAVNNSGVLSGKTITAISSGYGFNCALASGQVYCWGNNSVGQLGNGTITNSNVPVAVSTAGVLSGRTVTAIAAGDDHTCALASGAAYCWGKNDQGQLGNGTITNSNVPVAVSTAGILSGRTVTVLDGGVDHTCAIANGAAYCWGSNFYGKLGNNSLTSSNIPVAVYSAGVMNGKTITSIDGTLTLTCASSSDGLAYCWGDNDHGALGNNSNIDSTIPVAVTTSGVLSGKTISKVVSGVTSACALASGQVYCWGRGDNGQLGNNGYASSSVPVAVTTSGVLNGKTLTSVTAGANFYCGLSSGGVFCWGTNNWGQLGNGNGGEYNGSPVPVKVVNP